MIHCFNLPVYNSRVELQRSLETACHVYTRGRVCTFFTRGRGCKGGRVRNEIRVRIHFSQCFVPLSPLFLLLFSFFFFFFFQLLLLSFSLSLSLHHTTWLFVLQKARIPLIVDRLYVVETNRCEIKPVSNRSPLPLSLALRKLMNIDFNGTWNTLV